MAPRKNKPGAGKPRVYASELPLYDTMEQCAGATGVPVSLLKVAKKNGCPGFNHSRIHFSEFIRWWFAKPGQEAEDDDSIDWNKRDKKATALLKEAKLQEQSERVIDFNLARSFIEHVIGGMLFGELERYAQEFPASLKGKTEVEIHTECQKQIDLAKKNIAQAIETWKATKGKTSR